MECKSEGVVERGRESESEMCYRLGRSDQARCRFPISTKSRTESPGCARTRFTSQIQPGSLSTRGLSTSSWALAYPIPPPLAPPHWHFPSNAHNPSPTNYSCAFSAHLCQSQCFRSHPSTHHGTNSPLFFSPPRGNLLFQKQKKFKYGGKVVEWRGPVLASSLPPSLRDTSLTHTIPPSPSLPYTHDNE